MNILKVLGLSVVASIFSSSLFATPASDVALIVESYFELGKISVQQGNGVDAVKQFRMAANLGHQESMAVMATLCETGVAGEKSISESIYWYSKLVELGNAEFTEKLASLYVIGTENGEKNIEKGLELYKRVSIGNPHAQFVVGLIYDVEVDSVGHQDEAIKWYKIAAESKDAQALYILGTKYIMGEAVPQDGDEAYRMFKESADLGFDQAKYNLAICYAKGVGTKVDFKEAGAILKSLAEKNHVESLYVLALMKISGEVTIETEEPMRMLERASSLGNKDAKVYLDELNATKTK